MRRIVMIDSQQTKPTSEDRVSALEAEVAELREDVRLFISSVYNEAGASKAAHTAVITLLQMMATNPQALPALTDSLARAGEGLKGVDGIPPAYMQAFHAASARILTEVHMPAGGASIQ
jgi:hypothetical protein